MHDTCTDHNGKPLDQVMDQVHARLCKLLVNQVKLNLGEVYQDLKKCEESN